VSGTAGPPIELATGKSGSGAISVDDNFVYWAEPFDIMRVAKTGGETTTVLADFDGGVPVGIAVDETDVYWGTQGGAYRPEGLIMRVSK